MYSDESPCGYCDMNGYHHKPDVLMYTSTQKTKVILNCVYEQKCQLSWLGRRFIVFHLWMLQDMVTGNWSSLLRTFIRFFLLGGLMVHREFELPSSSATVTSSAVYASKNCIALWETCSDAVSSRASHQIKLEGV